MGKNENNLKEYINDFFDNVELYDDYHNGHNYKGLLKASIEVFLEFESPYTAYEIYETFFMIYQITAQNKSDDENGEYDVINEPNTLLDLVKIMKKYEENTGDLIEKQRDHFIHSVNVFILGLAIYSQNKNYRNKFREYVLKSPYKKYYRINGDFSNEEFLYRWGVASLFHDIGYPFEIIGKQLNKFINDGIKSISNAYGVETAIDFKDFNNFNTILKINPDFTDKYRETYPESKFLNLFKPTDIMAHKIITDFQSINITELTKHLDIFVDIMADNEFIDHGFFSSILVLNSYGYLIQNYAKDNDFFFYPIVDSATAILLHNYYRRVLHKKPFNLDSLDPEMSPLAFLLILCDELQEWNRQPFGVKDKKRSHVNRLLLEINDNQMNVEYIVESGSMGLGFSEDKQELLRDLLNIRSIFDEDLSIITDVKQTNITKEIVQSEIQTPDTLLRNVEKLAIEIHNQYNDTIKTQYEEKLANNEDIDDKLKRKYENLCPFTELSSQLKIANIRQAKSIPKKLNMIGCEIAYKSDSRDAILEFTHDEVMDLAISEHNDWWDEKIGTGWTYGERDDDNLVHDCLVPWEELTPEVQKYDIDPVKNIPNLLDSIGLKVVRSKIRLLTFKMHEFYNEENNVGEFDELPEYIKYSNYKQTNFLVKILGELGFDVVSDSAKGNSVKSFSAKELEYLAEREHNGWFKLKTTLGWVYGPQKDDKLKTNPNLKPWDELDDNIKLSNKHTFENLPMLCSEVGLKIVKN